MLLGKAGIMCQLVPTPIMSHLNNGLPFSEQKHRCKKDPMTNHQNACVLSLKLGDSQITIVAMVRAGSVCIMGQPQNSPCHCYIRRYGLNHPESVSLA